MSKRSHRSRENQRLRRQGERGITVNGVPYLYFVGRLFVIIRDLNYRKLWMPTTWEIKGITPYSFERGQWKRTSDGMILPSEVARWITTHDPLMEKA